MSENLSAPMIYEDLAPVAVPVKLGNKRYLLVEASAGVAAQWRNQILKSAKMGADGRPVSFVGMPDTEVFLISHCLYHADQEGNVPIKENGDYDKKSLVSEETIRRFPNRVQQDLFKRIKDISSIEQTEVDTEESLTKKIGELQERLDKLREGREEDSREKNLQ